MIAFSGLDGAGKSTQIELIQKFYKKENIKSKYFWSRGGYTPGMEKIKGLLRNSKSNHIPSNRGKSKEREQSFSKPIIRKIWLSLAILDLIYFYGVYIRVKELFGVRVICDRYIFDTSIDFRLNFSQENVNKWWLWRLMLLLAMKPNKHFVLTIPVEESLRRSKLKEEPFPDSEETLKTRLDDYLKYVSKSSNAIHINGNKSINDIHNFIIDKLKQ